MINIIQESSLTRHVRQVRCAAYALFYCLFIAQALEGKLFLDSFVLVDLLLAYLSIFLARIFGLP